MPKNSERPKPEFSAGTRTGTEIISVRFRFGNSYRNRNGHFTTYSPPKICSKHIDPHKLVRLKKLVLVLYSTKTYYTECFHYTAEKIFPMFIGSTLQPLKIKKIFIILFRY